MSSSILSPLLSSLALLTIAQYSFAIGADRSQRAGASVEAAPARAKTGDYVLQPQDVLRIFVFQHDDINKQTESVSISKEHTITLPLVRSVNLRGKTVRQAEEMIRAVYDKDYLVNPQVSVQVLKYAERSVNIVGQVNKPGRIEFPQERELSIVEAITLAGGFTRLADLKKVKLTRVAPGGENDAQEINVDVMMKSGGKESVMLQKDDVIFVPERIL
jgi:protein involved in polysaccharide export with SLBB domain